MLALLNYDGLGPALSAGTHPLLLEVLGVALAASTFVLAAKAAHNARQSARAVPKRAVPAKQIIVRDPIRRTTVDSIHAGAIHEPLVPVPPRAEVAKKEVSAPHAVSSPVGSGFWLLKAFAISVAVALVLLLGSYAALHWRAVVENPDKAFRIALATVCMFAGILADLLLTFTGSNRELKSIKAEEVLAPFAVSFLVFYSLWTHLVDSNSMLTASYNAFTSGLTWRRILGMVQDSHTWNQGK